MVSESRPILSLITDSGMPFAVAGDVEGQRYCYTDHSGYGFQVVVDVIADIAVSATLIGPGITDDGEQVPAFILGGICRVSSASLLSIR